jgi:hypothetical protein
VAGETARRLGARWTAPSVRDAVDVQPVDKVNALAVTAVASDPRWASRLATAFAGAVLRVRWRTIAGELDHRITDLGARLRAAPDDGDLAHQRRVIVGVRRSGRDPTLKLEGTDPAVAVGRAPAVAIVLLALLGGLFIGALAAVGLARFGSRVHNDDDVLLTYPLPVVARMRPGTAAAEDLRRLAVQVQHWAPEGGTIAVASASDGDGRTTAAAGLAAAIAEDGTAATVVELDRRPPVIEQRSEPPPVQELLAEARALADFVVVDAPPPSRDPRALRAATLADVVLLLVRLGHTARQELRKARELLEQTGVRPAGVVLVEGGDRRLMEGSHPADQASARPPAPPDAVSLRS